jgi:hypothetical protein
MNLLLLLERLEPSFQLFMIDERKRVLRAIMKVQACFRGHCQRRYFQRRRDLATVIQKRWRGAQVRKNLRGVLDQFNWRKRQLTSALLGKTEAVDSRRLDAARAKLEEATQQQERLAEKMGAGEGPRSLSPTASLRDRITKNLKESDRLRKLLNVNET